jgi:hypothetical protein
MIGCCRALLDNDGVYAKSLEQKTGRQSDRASANDEDRNPTRMIGACSHSVSPVVEPKDGKF